MPLSSGQTFAGYSIVRLLGSGGMGDVYVARHLVGGRYPRVPDNGHSSRVSQAHQSPGSGNNGFETRFQNSQRMASRFLAAAEGLVVFRSHQSIVFETVGEGRSNAPEQGTSRRMSR